MAYRTYRSLFRVRPAVTSIGEGRHRIRLPKGFQITLDLFILTVLLSFPCTFLFGGFMQSLTHPAIPPFIFGVVIALGISIKLETLDLEGKFTVNYIFDIVHYFFRSHVSDGFETQRKPSKWKLDTKVDVILVEDNRTGSLPAKGNVSMIEIKHPLAIKQRGGETIVSYPKSQHAYPKGMYKLHGKTIEETKPPPLLKRKS